MVATSIEQHTNQIIVCARAQLRNACILYAYAYNKHSTTTRLTRSAICNLNLNRQHTHTHMDKFAAIARSGDLEEHSRRAHHPKTDSTVADHVRRPRHAMMNTEHTWSNGHRWFGVHTTHAQTQPVHTLQTHTQKTPHNSRAILVRYSIKRTYAQSSETQSELRLWCAGTHDNLPPICRRVCIR